jgi:CHAT domain-containing protein
MLAALLVAATISGAPIDDVATGRALSRAAIDSANRWELEEAARGASNALRMAEACDDSVGKARALDALGIVARLRGQTDAAIGFTEEASGIAERSGDDDTLARIENDRGRIAFDLQLDSALAASWYERGLSRRPRLTDRALLARLLNNSGTLDLAAGDRAGAIRAYQDAAAVSAAAGDTLGTLTSEHNIGLTYAQQRSPALALIHLQRALTIERRIGDRSAQARTLLSISECARSLGNPSSAFTTLQEARRAANAGHDDLIRGTILLRLGELQLQRGRTSDAELLIEESIRLMEARGDRASLPQAETYRARLRVKQRRFREAASIASRAAAEAGRLGQTTVVAESRTIAGMALRRSGRLAAARIEFARAIDSVEAERSLVIGPEEILQQSFETLLAPYRELMAISTPPAAFALSERSRARVLFEVLRSDRNDIASVMTSAEKTRQRKLREQLLDAQRQNDAAAIKRAHSLYESFETELFVAHPELRLHARVPSPAALDTTSALLPQKGDAIIEYAMTDRALLIFVITQAGMKSTSVNLSRERVRTLSQRFAHDLSSRNLDFRKTARDLYDLLIAPIEPSLRETRRICIIPDDELWRVSYHALLDGQQHYLLERASIFYAPSVAVLREMTRGKPPKFDSLFAAGNSAASGSDRETAALAKIYAGRPSRIVMDATEREITQAMTHYHVLHLATHGVLDDTSPLDSHLVFKPSTHDDGLLDAREVMALDLDAELAVLSACEMAAGRPAEGEGLIGMSWAFFVAGCPSLITAQWRVESSSTTTLMIAFHRQLLAGDPGGHHSIADALRAAQLQLLHDGRHAHPYYWAPFIALGRGW